MKVTHFFTIKCSPQLFDDCKLALADEKGGTRRYLQTLPTMSQQQSVFGFFSNMYCAVRFWKGWLVTATGFASLSSYRCPCKMEHCKKFGPFFLEGDTSGWYLKSFWAYSYTEWFLNDDRSVPRTTRKWRVNRILLSGKRRRLSTVIHAMQNSNSERVN